MSDHDPFSVCDKQAAQEAQVKRVEAPEIPDSISTPCEFTITPATTISIIVSLLRQWFGSEERVTLDRGRFLWHPDLESSQIFIATDYPWNLDGVSGKPGLFVEHGSITTQPMRSMGMGKGNAMGMSMKTGEIYCASQYSADISIRCMCRSNLEAWALANEVKCFFDTYADAGADEYGFHYLTVRGVQKPVPIKEYGNFMAASTVLNYSILSTWGIMKEALPLKSIYGIPEINS